MPRFLAALRRRRFVHRTVGRIHGITAFVCAFTPAQLRQLDALAETYRLFVTDIKQNCDHYLVTVQSEP